MIIQIPSNLKIKMPIHLDGCFGNGGRRRDLEHYGVAGIETGGKQVSAGHLH